jgi:lipopolysaccharide biosynthesis regulator YciM
MDIYQQEKDWEKAIAAARQLESVSGQPLSPVVAQFQCELADRTAAKTHGNDPRALYAEALATDPNCVRASLSLARIDAAVGDWRGSIHTLKQVEHQDADYLPEILGPLCAGYRKIGDTDGLIDYLNACLRRQGSVSLVLALAEMVRETDGDQKAVEFIAEQLRQRPSVRGLDRLIELQMYHGDEEGRSDLSILKDLTTKLLESKPVYRCRSCGFASRSLYWQCPSCKSWNTVKPIHGVEGE